LFVSLRYKSDADKVASLNPGHIRRVRRVQLLNSYTEFIYRMYPTYTFIYKIYVIKPSLE